MILTSNTSAVAMATTISCHTNKYSLNLNYERIRLRPTKCDEEYIYTNGYDDVDDLLRYKLKVHVFEKYGLLLNNHTNKLHGGGNSTTSNMNIDYDTNYQLQQSITKNRKDYDGTISSWVQSKFSLLSSVIPISILFGAGYYAAASFLLNDTDLFNEFSSHSSSDDSNGEEEDDVIKNTVNDIAYESTSQDIRDVRLNYIITQVDISRMARNASRHLDVESILSLPTVVYHDKEVKEDEEQDKEEDDIKSYDNWSWQMIQQPISSIQLNQEISQQDTEALENKEKSTCSDNKDIEKDTTCVICLEAFKHKDVLRVLPCNHSFHIHCIDHWLLGTYSYDECYTSGCPICKKHLITEDNEEEEVIDSASSVLPSWAFNNIGNILAIHQQQVGGDCEYEEDEGEDVSEQNEVVILPIADIVTTISTSSSSSSSNNNSGDVVLLDTSDISCSVWQQEDK